jgi:hypothetical protein
MCKINYDELSFDHVVTFSLEDTLFATGRDGAGKARIFLVFSQDRERVYTRNGVVESWEILPEQDGQRVINRITEAIKRGIPTYKFSGDSQTVTGKNITVN